MNIVVDIEWCSYDLIKELGFCCGTFHAGFVFKSPSGLNISEKVICTNKWIKRHLKGIEWDDGSLEYYTLPTVIKLIKRPGAKFYAKGTKECSILSSLFYTNFINLDSIGCPRVFDLPSTGRDVCETTWFHQNSSDHCAQRKAILYWDWLDQSSLD